MEYFCRYTVKTIDNCAKSKALLLYTTMQFPILVFDKDVHTQEHTHKYRHIDEKNKANDAKSSKRIGIVSFGYINISSAASIWPASFAIVTDC